MRRNNEAGMAMLEYALGVALLLAAFITGGLIFANSSEYRRDQAMKTGETSLPCEGPLSGELCK